MMLEELDTVSSPAPDRKRTASGLATGSRLEANAIAIDQEVRWFSDCLESRYRSYFAEKGSRQADLPPPPDLNASRSYLAEINRLHPMDIAERLLLALALVPQICPQRLDPLLVSNDTVNGRRTEFGGLADKSHAGFIPTVETALFILGGDNISARFEHMALFDPDHFFFEQGLLRLERVSSNAPFGAAVLTITETGLHRLTSGEEHRPALSDRFPAKRVTTSLDWSELVLPPEALSELGAIETWIKEAGRIMHDWGFQRLLKPGYRSLFHGPPGTGKTLAATLLGSSTGLDVYRIDLSMTVSKYIGETEKNLAELFDTARHQRWILFFDEADALFGKRTATTSAHDRYANQEVSYLLQRIEDFEGVVILASNFKGNIDEAFARRFQSFVFFPLPDSEARLRLWRNMFADGGRLAADVDLQQLAETYELTGGAIVNVVRNAAIEALRHEREQISDRDLRRAIAKELRKEGKSA
jgi:hypothetical protein